jgi:hypothetical protein
MVQWLGEGDSYDVTIAARALSELKDQAAFDALVEALFDRDLSVGAREEVAHALPRIGGEKAVEHLARARRSLELNVWVITHALVETKSPKAIQPLVEILSAGSFHDAEYAAAALREIGDWSARKPLVEYVRRNPIGCRLGIEALSRMCEVGDPEVMHLLARAMSANAENCFLMSEDIFQY